MNIEFNKPNSLIKKPFNSRTKLKDFFNLDGKVSFNKENLYFNTIHHLDSESYKNIIHCIIKLIKIDNKLIVNKQNKTLKKDLMSYINNFNLEHISSFDNQYQKSLQNIFYEIHTMLNSKIYNGFKLINQFLKLLNVIGFTILFLDIVILVTVLVLDKSLSEFKDTLALSSNNDRLNYIMLSFYVSLVVLILNKIINNRFTNAPIKIIDNNFYNGNYCYLKGNSEFIESLKNNSKNNQIIKSINNDDIELEFYDNDLLEPCMNCIKAVFKCFGYLVKYIITE